MAKVLEDVKGKLFIWLGLLIFGVGEFMYSGMKLAYYDKIYCGASTKPKDCDYYYLAYVGFFFSGIMKIIASLPKLNSHKLVQLISFAVHAVMIIFGIAALGGISSVDGFSNYSDQFKGYKLQGSVLLFGSSIGFTVYYLGMWLHVKADE